MMVYGIKTAQLVRAAELRPEIAEWAGAQRAKLGAES